MEAKAMLDALGAPFPANAVEQREGSGSKMFSYVAAETVIRRLNAAAVSWDFRMTGHVFMPLVRYKNNRGEEKASQTLIVFGELTIPGLGTRSGTGVQIIDPEGRAGEDMIKGAMSDCLKKCATQFGVALELYGPDLEAGEIPDNTPPRARTTTQNTIPPARQEFTAPDNRHPAPQQPAGTENPATPRQIKFIEAIAREHGIGMDELNAEVTQLYGRQMYQLDRRDASAFIERLQSRRNITDLAS